MVVFGNHNISMAVCYGSLAGFKLAVGAFVDAAAYGVVAVVHGAAAGAELRHTRQGAANPEPEEDDTA